MIHLFVNAFAASAGGGLTYLRNVVPLLGTRSDVRASVFLSPQLRQEFGAWGNITFIEGPRLSNAAARFWFEQTRLPRIIRKSGANVLLSTGNFAMWNSPVPQILLSRNALYTSTDFVNDIRQRADYRLWIDTQLKGTLAKWSIQRADITVSPSEAFAKELRQWTGMEIVPIHHGFDPARFASDRRPFPREIGEKLALTLEGLRLLFVSHYNYYRNFEVLIRALPLLREQLAPRRVSLVLTCRLDSKANPGSYHAESAATLVKELGVSENVVELGSVHYNLLHQVYKACDIYVTPAYAESFAHPLVEAMSSGLPVVASDIAVHREICGKAALYFDRFSAAELADRVEHIVNCENVAVLLSTEGRQRSQYFSWRNHLEQIVGLARQLLSHYSGDKRKKAGSSQLRLQ
jgi:glycosyltransferase involved in cell wall biosynthesis